jgi:hypothetical protein
MAYILPPVDQPPPSGPTGPRHKIPRFAHLGDLFLIGMAVGLVGFLAALITAIVTAGGD